MSVQISLTLPDFLFKSVKKRSKEHGFRSVQEDLLQCARDKIFLENLPRYERVMREMQKEGKMSKEDLFAWLDNPK